MLRLEAVARNQQIPVTTGQLDLWHANQSERGVIYNELLEICIDGHVDIQKIQYCFNRIIARHESLRTVFRLNNKGVLLQHIHKPYKLTLAQQAIDDSSDGDIAKVAIKKIIKTLTENLVCLNKLPLFSVHLLHFNNNKKILLISFHHIIMDGAACYNFLHEWKQLDIALAQNIKPDLPDLPVQMADYAVWEQRFVHSQLSERAVNYWKNKLHHAPARLDFPYDRMPAHSVCPAGARVLLDIPRCLVKRLTDIARQTTVSLSTVLLSALQVLLMRYTGQRDMVVALSGENRQFIEQKPVIGHLADITIVRNHLSGNMHFNDLLVQANAAATEAAYIYNLPYRTLLKIAQTECGHPNTPLYQVCLAYSEFPAEPVSFSDFVIEQLNFHSTGYARAELTISLNNTGKGMQGYVEYNTELFDQHTIVNLTGHYLNLLHSVGSEPGNKIAALDLLTTTERNTLLSTYNASASFCSGDQLIHQLFENRCAATPDAIAATDSETNITFKQLNQQANQLAHCLITYGVRAEKRIGICMHRSVDLLIAMLAVVKAAGTYVPIDPANPQRRTVGILQDSNALLLLTETAIANTLTIPDNIPCFLLDADKRMLNEFSTENPQVTLFSLNSIYIMFTSGSTGKPKGVVVSHASLLNLFYWHKPTFKLYNTARVTQLAAPGFDAMVWEVWPALASGAQLLFVSTELITTPDKLIEWLYARKITHCFIPTALLTILFMQHWPKVGAIHCLMTGGDKLNLPVKKHFPFQLTNNYGTTEATIVTTCGIIDPLSSARPAIGKAIRNTCVYILDACLNLLPGGVRGYLYIAGAGLSRGYLNQPALTAEKFIPDPFSRIAGARLYNTGDLARYLPDGNIDYLGRADNQINIRGFRIEPDEIQQQLCKFDGVQQALLRSVQDNTGNQQLIAWLVINKNSQTFRHHNTNQPAKQLAQTVLRNYLSSRLPDYMVPSFMVIVDKLPLTANGKIDTNALPAPDISTLSRRVYITARTAMQKKLLSIWSHVFNIPEKKISITDDFYQLGGTSIVAMTCVERCRRQGITISLKTIFDKRTIEAIANVSESGKNEKISLIKEAQLDKHITGKNLLACQNGDILLTGATGFIGIFLLKELLKHRQSRIYCLINAKTSHQARQRLRQKLHDYKINNAMVFQRVILLNGNLREPCLGLCEEQFKQLAGSISVIYHIASWVNHLLPYDTLKAVNVDGTKEILRLATYKTLKTVHYTSTLAVAALERTIADQHFSVPELGYLLSKLVCEKLLQAAHRRNVPIYIYRLGMTGGHSVSGALNTSNRICQFIKGCILLNCIPDSCALAQLLPASVTAVDDVVKHIVAVPQTQINDNCVMAIENPQRIDWGDLLLSLEQLGYHLRILPLKTWRRALANKAGQTPGDTFDIVNKLYNNNVSELSCFELAQNTINTPEKPGTETGSHYQVVNQSMLYQYLKYLIATGFLPSPDKRCCKQAL